MAMTILIGAAAAMATPADDLSRLDFNCSGSEVSSDLRIHLGRANYRVRGHIYPYNLDDIPDTSKPIQVEGNDIPNTSRYASVEIADESYETSLSFSVIARDRQPGDGSIVSDVRVHTRIDEEDRSYDLTIQTRRDYRDALPFDIQVEGDKVSVVSGEKRLDLTVPIGPKSIAEFYCIGGRYHFDDIEISE